MLVQHIKLISPKIYERLLSNVPGGAYVISVNSGNAKIQLKDYGLLKDQAGDIIVIRLKPGQTFDLGKGKVVIR